MYDRELKSWKSADLWAYLLEEASAPGTIVLVNNLLMEREVRRKWQRDKNGVAPDIRTLESWLEELALHSLPEEEIPGLIMLDEERTLWLEQWLSAHPDPDFRRFSGGKTVTAISNVIGSLYRDNHRPAALLEFVRKRLKGSGIAASRQRYTLAEVLVAYEEEMVRKKWLDREQLIGKMAKVSPVMMRYRKMVLFYPDEVDVIQENALRLVSESENSPELVAIRFDSDERDDSVPNLGKVYLEQFHHPREELEESVRHILSLMLQQNGGSVGARFDDYVILTGDLSLYESMVESVAARFDIPLYTSRGMSLISHPFIRRLLTYLKLEHNGFQIDDIFRVFADNRIALPELEDHDEQKPPNIRHFSQFCRAYNFRTLEEVSAGMSRIFDWLLEQVQYQDDEERELKRKASLRRDREFYNDVVRHLEAFRKRYKTPDRQNLTDWVTWSNSLLDLQKDLMSREANESRELMSVILGKVAKAQEKLGLGKKISRHDFFKLLELRLKETRERPVERPGGVLLTEIRHLPDVHDKIVFVLGLHEDGFPKPDRPDFLQFRYEAALQALTGRDGTEEYDLARMQLRRLLASEHARFLSRPALVEQKRVMPSPLWLELEEQMRLDHRSVKQSGEADLPDASRSGGKSASRSGGKSELRNGGNSASRSGGNSESRTGILLDGWPDGRKKLLFSDHEAGLGAVSGNLKIGEASQPDKMKHVIRQFQLAANVEENRQNPDSMGRYDGMIDPGIMDHWRKQNMGDGRIAMSISRLDKFASSPQEYFFKYILRLQPLHEYQDDAESNIKGSILHHILQDFYSETEAEGPPVRPADDPKAALSRMNAIRVRLVNSYRHQLGNPASPFPEILSKNLEQVTRWFVEVESAGYPEFIEGLEEARPSVFYPEFDIAMEHKWEFERQLDDITVVFRGMIDRIDMTPEGQCGVIFDYKSGRFGVKNYKDIVNGLSFQLPVYGMYVRERSIPNYLAGYYQLPVNGKKKDVQIKFALGSAELIREQDLNKKSGERKKTMVQYKPAEEMEAFITAIENRRIAWIARAIRDGRFHVSLTGDPKWSDYRFINRYNSRIQHIRSNRERTGRETKGIEAELDRYYLAVPFWEDRHE